jgi:hypothetical protein
MTDWGSWNRQRHEEKQRRPPVFFFPVFAMIVGRVHACDLAAYVCMWLYAFGNLYRRGSGFRCRSTTATTEPLRNSQQARKPVGVFILSLVIYTRSPAELMQRHPTLCRQSVIAKPAALAGVVVVVAAVTRAAAAGAVRHGGEEEKKRSDGNV